MEYNQAIELGRVIREARAAQGISTRDLASEVLIDKAQIIRLEQGLVAKPQPAVLSGIAKVLGLEVADLYSLAGYTRPTELPNFVPYLRAKYQALPDDAIAEMERYFEEVARKHGTTGPKDGEDE